MFTKLHIHNYKAIGPEPLDLDLAPITILVGRSGSGKSCVLEALALTAQSAVEDPQRHDLILSGSRLKLPIEGYQDYREPYRQICHAGSYDSPISVGFSWREAGDGEENQTFDYRWTRKGNESPRLDHCLGLDGSLFLRMWTDVKKTGSQGVVYTPHMEFRGKAIPDDLVRGSGADRVLSEKIVEAVRQMLLNAQKSPDLELAAASWEGTEVILEQLKTSLGGVHFLSSLRGADLMHTEPGPKVSFVGLHGENTVRLLASIDARTRKGYKALRRWAKEFGLPEIETGADGNQLKVVFADPHTHASMDLWQAATGSKQGLILAAHMLLSSEGSTLLVEEPDANMHPGYEKLLPALFAESTKGNRQVLATTHSEILVAAMGNAVRKGLLKPQDVAIYHLERDELGVRAERLDMSQKGNLAGWVKSFAEVEKDLFNEWYQELPEDGPEAGS